MNPAIPEFAVLGHPNEGKSSLVSTLSEDDTVRISPYPGETTECRVFPVIIDGREIVRFTDTPGFQVPQKTLAWFEHCSEHGINKVKEFIEKNKNDPLFRDECELLKPLARNANIIFVVDGSRP
ncbi:MAG: GTPase, partial [Desulfobacteraceae bacterium]